MEAALRDVGSREVVFDSDLITVWCYPEARIIHHKMHRHCYGPVFREALTAGIAAMREHRADSWLSDDRKNGPLPDDDELWGATVWFQQAKAAGWKHWAMVMPSQAVGKLNVKRLVEHYRRQGVDALMFGEPDAAFDWLFSKHP